MKASPHYGVRSRRTATSNGTRNTARTFGKARIGTYTPKAEGHITVESESERLVASMLTIDPRVSSFKQQPFTVDLIEERLLFTRQEVLEARRKYGRGHGSYAYTPDFSAMLSDGLQLAHEVKLLGYEGDETYWKKIEKAAAILQAYAYKLITVVVPSDERHPLLVNSQLLKPLLCRAHSYLSKSLIEKVESYCQRGPVLQRNLCADLDIPTNLIPALLATGVLSADLVKQRISSNLELCAAYGDLSHLCLMDHLIVDTPCFAKGAG